MQDSSSDQQSNIYQNNNFLLQQDSLNQTAVSINQELIGLEADDTNGQAEQLLRQFYKQKLQIQADFKYNDLENDQQIFKNGIVAIYPPEPLVYFLPYTILVKKSQNLIHIRDRITQKYRPLVQSKKISLNIFFYDVNNQLSVKIHSQTQMVFYRIKKLRIQQKMHTFVDCLDPDLLIDRLFNIYKLTYEKFYFEEVSTYFLYWIYKRGFLCEQYISPSAAKVIIICLFVGLPFGIQNIMMDFLKSKNFWKRQSECLNMIKCNKKGQMIIDRDIQKYRNYTIQEKKGFYIVGSRKSQMIKSILPILFPIGQRVKDAANRYKYKEDEQKYYRKSGDDLYKKLIKKQTVISRYRMLHLLFKYLNTYFDRGNKILLDLKRKQVVFEEASNQFFLQIEHPVLNKTISKNLAQNGSSIRRVKIQLNQVMKKYKQEEYPVNNILYLIKK